MEQSKEEKDLRGRCKRWIGSICRNDRFTNMILLSADFSWFWIKVTNRLKNKNLDVKECVEKANMEELRKLFHEIEEYRIDKYFKRSR